MPMAGPVGIHPFQVNAIAANVEAKKEQEQGTAEKFA